MKIAQVTNLAESVPPKNKAGLEQMVYYLIEELVKLGHEVTLFGTADSKTSAKLVPIWPRGFLQDPYGKILSSQTYALKAVSVACMQASQFDIIHDHGDTAGYFAGAIPTPVILTLHHPIPDDFAAQYPPNYRKYLDYSIKRKADYEFSQPVTVSKFQAKKIKGKCSVVHNGIPIDEWNKFSYNPGKFLAFLGYISGVKGVAEAIQATLKTKEKLIIAGPIDLHDQDSRIYFEEDVEPFIDGKQIRYIGPLGHDEKMDFLKKAKATLMPIQWDEPFGLVAIESMACGTPVIAWDRGAMPEIIEDGNTGYLVKSVDEMAKKISKIDKLSRKACRQRVERYFSAAKMAKGYEELYYKLVNQHKE